MSANLIAGVGDGSPNPTGGFGDGGDGSNLTNPTGGFGDYSEDFDIQAAPPPPPPNEVPIDGGALMLVFSCLGVGAVTIIQKFRR